MSANPPQGRNLPDEFEEHDFSIDQENWSEYELNDGTRIRARLIITKIMADPHNPNALMFDFNPIIIAVYAPVQNRGERNNEPRPEEWNTLPSFEAVPIRSDERWNRYRILRTGRIVRCRATVTRIRRVTDRFNLDGMPFFLIDNSPMVTVDPPDQHPGP